MQQKGITLIGMPGSGKSTIGKRLAKALGKQYLDLDQLIEQKYGEHHREVLQKQGDEAFLKLEAQLVLDLDLHNAIFAPGGSIIYSKSAMKKIKNESTIFYLRVERETLQKRLGKLQHSRGIVGLQEHGFDKLFDTRRKFYEKYADVIIDTTKLTKGKTADAILTLLLEATL